MKVVLKYLKPFAFILLLCVILLFGQALSDLSLPNLMSDIVNVGLQKNGVDEPVPEKISEQGMALVCLLMKEEDREIFQSGYEKKDGIYVLSSDRVEQKTQEVYEQSALTLMNLLKSSASQSGQTQSESDADLSGIGGEMLYQMLPFLQSIPQQMVDEAYLAALQAYD